MIRSVLLVKRFPCDPCTSFGEQATLTEWQVTNGAPLASFGTIFMGNGTTVVSARSG